MLVRYDKTLPGPDCFATCTDPTFDDYSFVPLRSEYRQKVSVKKLRLRHSASTPLYAPSHTSSVRIIPSENSRPVMQPQQPMKKL